MIETLTGWIVTASLKGALLILVVGALLWIGRDRIQARWRYAIWMVVLLRLALPMAPEASFSVFNLIPLPERNGGGIGIRQVFPAPAPILDSLVPATLIEATAPRFEAARTAGWIWLGGFTLLAARLGFASVRLHRQIRRSDGAPLPVAVISVFNECRRQLGVHRKVRLLQTDLVRSPALHGMARPVLLLPAGFAETFDADELRFVFLHELAHLKRHDVAVNWAIAAMQVTHWFNPLVWIATIRMREERELACDELALSWLQQEERRGYGRTILKLLDRFRSPTPIPALLGILNDKEQMKRRLLMITRFRTHTRYSLLFLGLVIALAAVSLTDARAGEKMRMLKPLDPAAHATLEKLESKLSFELTDATLGEVLATLTGRTGVTFTQSADVSADAAQQKRITITAEQVPAHAVLMETLATLGFGFEPTAEGVTISKSRGIRRMMLLEHHPEAGGKFERKIVRRSGELPAEVEDEIEIETNGTPDEVERTIEALEGENSDEQGINEEIFVRKIGPGAEKIGADGVIRRNLVLKMKDNGVVTTGKLLIEVR